MRITDLEKVDMQKVLRDIKQLQGAVDILKGKQEELEKRIDELEKDAGKLKYRRA